MVKLNTEVDQRNRKDIMRYKLKYCGHKLLTSMGCNPQRSTISSNLYFVKCSGNSFNGGVFEWDCLQATKLRDQ